MHLFLNPNIQSMTEKNLQKGHLLISEPFLGDPNFERSVVLLCEHNAQSSFGFVLNQKTDMTLMQVWEETSYCDFPIYIGGPVQKNTLHFIHRLGNQIDNSLEIAKDLYWSGDYEQVATLLNFGKIKEHDIRFFLGYSGWSENQLANEIQQNAWIISQGDSSFIFDTQSKDFWRGILKKMGGKYKMIANYPIDPSLN